MVKLSKNGSPRPTSGLADWQPHSKDEEKSVKEKRKKLLDSTEGKESKEN